jgi:hypothetical protein
MKRNFHAMKNLFLICCCFAIVSACGQNKQATMEKRARELHRIMGLNDKEQWEKFMKENYTKSLLERPVKSSVKTTEKETESSTSTTSTIDKLEEKLKIFEKLHNDFGKSNIVSLRPVNEKIEMVLEKYVGE